MPHRVVAVGQRGHRRGAWASDYREATIAGDLLAVIDDLGVDQPAAVAEVLSAFLVAG